MVRGRSERMANGEKGSGVKNIDIVGLLIEYRAAKNKAKELRTEMLRVAVQELGMDQKEALQVNLIDFLDGYLVGQGMQQSWRDIASDREAA